MADRPIIFSAPMVRALLAGRKTQTRRLATSPLRRCAVGDRLWVRESFAAEEISSPPQTVAATAKERRVSGRTAKIVIDELDGCDGLRYLADDQWLKIENTPEAGEAWVEAFHYGFKDGSHPSGYRGKSIPSIHMPRWASRLTLIVEAVRTERLRAITNHDAIYEGWDAELFVDGPWPIDWYRELWQSLHDKPGQRWDDNPDVLVLTFSVERDNIDRLREQSEARSEAKA